MADENDTDALCGQLTDRIEQVLGFALCQNGSRLVEYQEAYSGLIDLTSDLNELHVSYRKAMYPGVLLDIHAHGIKSFSGILSHVFVVECLKALSENLGHSRALRGLTVELDVLSDCESRYKHEFLVHHTDSGFHGVTRVHDIGIFTTDTYLSRESTSFVDHRHTEQDVHQCGLTRAVFADKSMNLARTYVHVDPLQNGMTRVFLSDIDKFKNPVVQNVSPFIVCN